MTEVTGHDQVPEMRVTRDHMNLADKAVKALLGSDENFRELTHGDLFSFGIAQIAMDRGHMVARASWGNPGKFVFLQAGDQMYDPESGAPAQLKPHYVWKNDRGEFVPWVASNDALLANDWFIGKSGEYPYGRPPASEPIQH